MPGTSACSCNPRPRRSVVPAGRIPQLLQQEAQPVGGVLLHQLPLDQQAVGAGQPCLPCLLDAAAGRSGMGWVVGGGGVADAVCCLGTAAGSTERAARC